MNLSAFPVTPGMRFFASEDTLPADAGQMYRQIPGEANRLFKKLKEEGYHGTAGYKKTSNKADR